MTEFVFKPTGARLYSGRYRVMGETKITTVRLAVTDKQVARAKLRTIVQQRERELAGIMPRSEEIEAGNTPLRDHLDALLEFKARTRDAKYLAALKNQVVTILDECGWTVLRDLNAEQFERWRQNRRASAKTLNEYLTAVRTLINWMVATRRASDNPLRHVELYASDGPARTRRALSDDEARALLKASGKHRIVYHAALQTGLRRKELKHLRVSDLALLDSRPKVFLRGSTTKNRKSESLPLTSDLASELRNYIADRGLRADELLFEGLVPSMPTHREILSAAGVSFVNDEGLRADFHALRHTYTTNVQRTGATQRELMALARHSDRRLSDHVYTDTNLLPLAAIVQALPDFSPIQIATKWRR